MDKKVLSTVITVAAAVLSAALAVWGGYVFCTQVKIGQNSELYALIPVYCILIVLGAFIDEIIHEGAHFLAGAICSMGVKPPKIRIFKSSSVEMYPKGIKAMRLRFLITAAAGLLFDLLIIALGIIALVVPSVPALLALGLPYAFYSFVINAVPLEYGSGKTDGLVICEALSGSPSSQVMFAVLKIQGKVNSGFLLREIEESWLLDVPQIQEDDINFIILTQLRYEYYLAKGDDSTAYKYFMRYKQLIRYLPSEYSGSYNKRADYDEEEASTAEVNPANLDGAAKENNSEKLSENSDADDEPSEEAAALQGEADIKHGENN